MTEFLSKACLFVDIEKTYEWHFYQANIRLQGKQIFRADLKTRAGAGFVFQFGLAVSGYGETEQEALSELVNTINYAHESGESRILELPTGGTKYSLASIDLTAKLELDVILPDLTYK